MANTVTGWASYTPTFTNFGTSPTSSLFWRQVGENVEIYGSVTVGTSPAAAEGRISLPNSYTADSTVLTLEPVGNWWLGNSGTAGHGGLVLAQPSTGYIVLSNFQVFGSGTTNPIASANASANFASANVFFLSNISVKISGLTP